MKKYLLAAAAFTALIAGSAVLPSQPAQASWAENAQGNPYFTGTERSLQRSHRAQRHFSHRGYRWNRGYSAYGYAPRHHRGSYGYYGGDYYR